MHKYMSFIKKRLIFLASLLVLAAGLIYYFWPSAGPPPEQEFVVEVESVKKGDLTKSVKLLAQVSSAMESSLLSSVKGTMKSIYAEEGKPVKKGTLLAELDNGELAREFDHAKQKVALAQAHYDRIKQLQGSQAQSQVKLELAHDILLRAKIELEQVQDRLGKTRFVAQFDGVCGVFKFRPGQTVSDGDVIISCYDASGFSLKIDVPQSLLAEVQPGEKIHYKGEESKILSVQKSLDPESHMGIARAEVPVSWNVSPGQLISLTVDVESRQAVISLPRSAVFLKDGNSFVYTIVEGKANLESVDVGLQGKHRVEITEGLKEGDKVVLKGQENIWPTRALKELKPKEQKAEKPKE
jgi:membrane fusion protein (multidrug efflux system)